VQAVVWLVSNTYMFLPLCSFAARVFWATRCCAAQEVLKYRHICTARSVILKTYSGSAASTR